MGNEAELRVGMRTAKDIIGRHILNAVLVPAAKELIEEAKRGRIALGHNMTGNTVNSYAAGIYVRGRLVFIETSAGSIPRPLRRKLTKGTKPKGTTAFFPGDQRWDGEMQEGLFKAKVQTNSETEPGRSVKFLQGYQANPNGWTLVVCNGVEYATFQENQMEIDVLTRSFDYSKMFAPTMFKPIPD